MFSLVGAWINGWVNNREAGYLRRYRGHYDVIVMKADILWIMGQVSENVTQVLLPVVSVDEQMCISV